MAREALVLTSMFWAVSTASGLSAGCVEAWASSACNLVAFHLDFLLARTGLRDIIGKLHAHEQVHADAEGLFQPERHVGGEGRLSVDEVGESLAGHIEGGRRFRDGEPKRLEHFAPDEAAEMGRVFQGHLASSSSVIVRQ